MDDDDFDDLLPNNDEFERNLNNGVQNMDWLTKLSSPAQLAKDKGIKMGIIGLPASGKTRLLATAPKPVIISLERGTLSLVGQGEDIQVIEVKNYAEAIDAARWAVTQPQFETVCFDSYSELCSMLFGQRTAEKPNDGFYGYGAIDKELIPAFKNLVNERAGAKNMIVTAKMALVEDGAAGVTIGRPAGVGKNSGMELAHTLDEIYVAYTRKTAEGIEYRLQTRKTGERFNYDIKSRGGTLIQAEYKDANLSEIIAKLKGI